MALAATSRSRPTETNPFDELDADWAALCHQHRRSATVARWARTEPALATARGLADVIPSSKDERAQACMALARLSAHGDDLAARALLQILVPGIIRIAKRWCADYGGTWDAGYEILARVSEYIARLRRVEIRCGPAGYILRSVERDLVTHARRTRQTGPELMPTDTIVDLSDTRRPVTMPSAEDDALAGPLVHAALEEAATNGAITAEAAQVVWLHAEGHSIPAAGSATGISTYKAYQLHDRGLGVIRRHLTLPGP